MSATAGAPKVTSPAKMIATPASPRTAQTVRAALSLWTPSAAARSPVERGIVAKKIAATPLGMRTSPQ
jgi:hypothetical protein